MHTTTYSCQVSAPTECSQPPLLVQCLLSFYLQHCLSLLAKVLSTQHILSESPAWAVLKKTVYPSMLLFARFGHVQCHTNPVNLILILLLYSLALLVVWLVLLIF